MFGPQGTPNREYTAGSIHVFGEITPSGIPSSPARSVLRNWENFFEQVGDLLHLKTDRLAPDTGSTIGL
jgi:hypothetical protein